MAKTEPKRRRNIQEDEDYNPYPNPADPDDVFENGSSGLEGDDMYGG